MLPEATATRRPMTLRGNSLLRRTATASSACRSCSCSACCAAAAAALAAGQRRSAQDERHRRHRPAVRGRRRPPRAVPDARLVFFAGADNAAAPRVGRRPRRARHAVGRPALSARSRALRRHRVDVLLDFGSWPRIDAVLAACSGSGCTVGFRTDGQRRHYAHDVVVEHLDSVHELDNYRRLLAAIGVEAGSTPALRPPGTGPSTSCRCPTPSCTCSPAGTGRSSGSGRTSAGGARHRARRPRLRRRPDGCGPRAGARRGIRRVVRAAAGRLVDLAGRLSLTDAARRRGRQRARRERQHRPDAHRRSRRYADGRAQRARPRSAAGGRWAPPASPSTRATTAAASSTSEASTRATGGLHADGIAVDGRGRRDRRPARRRTRTGRCRLTNADGQARPPGGAP